MAAVLAKKQAEPLIAEMVALGGLLRREMEEGRDFLGKEQWTYRLPAAMARLMQCLVEEAEASGMVARSIEKTGFRGVAVAPRSQ